MEILVETLGATKMVIGQGGEIPAKHRGDHRAKYDPNYPG